ncbi:hypothetical protein KP509_39G043300 [Ceratopteris richardii]|uniref:PUM-HD domain-containing protein n=1 Tax=Ceratopteris richardii TaxID=49495 RepID=A0A8T2Q0S8_CERRI|nr:hypothetical protein KP509_39G043300 [Ceratopteris richardii]
MKQEDEEFEKLLGEIPHVTNGVSQGFSSSSIEASLTCTSSENLASDCASSHAVSSTGPDLYEGLFSVYQVTDGLQQAVDLHPQSYSVGMPNVKVTEHNAKLTPSGEDIKRCLPNIDGGEEPLSSLGFAESHPTELPDDSSLIAALSKATLEVKPVEKKVLKAQNSLKGMQNANGNNNADNVISLPANHHFDFPQHITASFNQNIPGMSSVISETSKIVSKKIDISSSYAYGHPLRESDRQEIFSNCDPSHSGVSCSSSGMMLAYATGLGSTPRVMKNTLGYSRGYVNPSFLGDGSGSQHRIVAFPYCNGINNHVYENDSTVYYDSGSFNEFSGSTMGSHNVKIIDRPHQVPPANFHHLQLLPQQSEVQANYFHHQDSSISSYHHTKACRLLPNWQRREDDRQQMQVLFGSHSQVALDCGHQHYQGPPLHQSHAFTFPSFYTASDQPCKPFHVGQMADTTDWKLQYCSTELGRFNHHGLVPQMVGDCAYPIQTFGNRGDTCQIIHTKTKNVNKNKPFKVGAISPCSGAPSVLPQEKSSFRPVRILARESPLSAETMVSLPSVDKTDNASHRCTSSDFFGGDTHPQIDNQHSRGNASQALEDNWPKGQIASQCKYNSLEDVRGHIYTIAKDQHGCRFLQRQFDEGGPKEVEIIFLEIIEHILELMIDPFGNYLVQKLLEVCSEDQRSKILNMTTVNGELINISLNMHGTRAVQKLIETLKTSQQVSMVTAALRPGVVTLIKDLNGNHVVQRCLQHLSIEDSQFIFEVVTSHCVEIATHRHGCCVLQRCIDFSRGTPQQRLIAEIAANALLLSQDPFGNYVVQYVLDLRRPWIATKVIEQLMGHFAHLSMQKFSSNVVEKCLKFADEEHKNQLIRELMEDSHLLELLQDPYANYVIQSALMVSKVDSRSDQTVNRIGSLTARSAK